MNKKVIIISVLGLGIIITAGFLIKVQITNAPLGSIAAKWVTNHPQATDPDGVVTVPLLIKVISKGTT